MILRSSCAFKSKTSEDGFRILIVSRLTEKDGVTPDLQLMKVATSADCWMPPLAPRPRTVGAWYRNEITWDQFRTYYTEYLESPEGQSALGVLYCILKEKSVVTVLCVEETPQYCHRSLLLEYMQKKYPEIEIVLL